MSKLAWSQLIHKAAHGNRGLTLENLDDALPEGGEEHIEQCADMHENALEVLERTNEALESITEYTSRLEKMIEDKSITLESLALIRMGVEKECDRIGQEITFPSLEGVAEDDVNGQAKVALEGFKDFLNNLAQAYVMTFKHLRDALIDSSRAVSLALPRHEKKMLECKRHYADVKGDLADGEIRFAPIGFEYFIINGNVQGGNDLVANIKKDVEIDKYLLVTYPKRILQELNAAISAINAASIKNVDDIVKLGKKIEGFKMPSEMFEGKYTEHAVLFGMNVGHDKNKAKKQIKGHEGAEGLSRLAEMAGSGAPRLKVGLRSYIGQVVHGMNQILPAYMGGPGAMAAVHTTQQVAKAAAHASWKDSNFFVPTKAIPSFFDAAEGYLDNIRAHLSLEREFVRAADGADGAIEKLEDKVEAAYEEHVSGKSATQESFDKAWAETDIAMKVIKQIMQYLDALSRSLLRVSSFEQRRAFHCAKSCNYIGLRLIFNAPKKDGKPATEGVSDEVARLQAEAHEEMKHREFCMTAGKKDEVAKCDEKLAKLKEQIAAAKEKPATEGIKDKTTKGKIEGTGKSHVGQMIACNFAEGPEVVKVVELHFAEGKTHILAKKPGKGEYLVAQASGEQAEHGCFAHCQEVMLGMQDEAQAKEVFSAKIKKTK